MPVTRHTSPVADRAILRICASMAPMSTGRNLPVVQAFPSCYRPYFVPSFSPKKTLFLPISPVWSPDFGTAPSQLIKPNAVCRGHRLLLVVQVCFQQEPAGSPFFEEAFTQVVKAHGALIVMKQIVSVGTHLRLKNKKAGEEFWLRHRRSWRPLQSKIGRWR